MSIPRHAYLNDLASKEIAELTEQGITVSHADAVMLNSICWEMRGVGIESAGCSRGRAVQAGNATLYPMTIQALEVLDEISTDEMDEKDQLYTLAYIMAHGRNECAFDCGIDSDLVKAWAAKLTCTIEELGDAVAQINRQSTEYATFSRVSNSDNSRAFDLAITCQRIFGETAEYWESQVSSSYAMRIVLEEVAAKSGKATSPRSTMLTNAMAHYIDGIKERSQNGTH